MLFKVRLDLSNAAQLEVRAEDLLNLLGFHWIDDLYVVRDIIRVVANTGMRNSELSSLTLSGIDFERKCLLAGEGRK
jgi:integrase